MDYLIAVYTGRKIYTITVKPAVTVTIGSAQNDTLFIDRPELRAGHIVLSCDAGGVRVFSVLPVKFGGETVSKIVLSAGDVLSVTGKITLAVFEAKCRLHSALSLEGFDELRIGRSYNSNNICLKDWNISPCHALLKKVSGKWVISDLQSRNGTFVNGELVPIGSEIPAENMNIFIYGYVFYIQDNMLRFTNIPGKIEFSPEIVDVLVPMPERQKAYPFFQRSPRIRNGVGEAEFEIAAPPNVGTKPSVSWITVILPTILMIVVMIFVAVFNGNYNMMIYSLPISIMYVAIAVMNNNITMKKWLKNNGLAVEKYSEYLSETDRKIDECEGAFISSLSSVNPGVIECLSIAKNVSRRLWERSPKDSDFLNVRVGTGSRESNVKIKLPAAQIFIEDDTFVAQAKAIRDKHKVLNGIPVCHSLLNYPVTGLAGSREEVIHTAWRIIMDIAVHHSYEDVKIICVYPEDECSQWEWLRWLPHVWDEKHKKRYLACRIDDACSLLRETSETMKFRQKDIRRGVKATPFYIVVLADRTLTDASGETFLPESPALGFAALYVYGDIASLPGECQSVIMCDTPAKIQNYDPVRGSTSIPFMPDKISVSILDEFARALAPVRLIAAGGGNKMPSKISLLQGFNVNRIEELDIMSCWKHAKPEKSLAVPIGIRENGDTFYFNIFDSSKGTGGMGPHGIIVGTAGSGKTEALNTLLLSMAMMFSPEDVNFVLLEFKGESFSGVLKSLPHVAGVITNLNDSSVVIRGLRSLLAENKRRQRILAGITELVSKNLPEYQVYRKIHPELNLEPMPHLIVVIEEFAEFIIQYPEYRETILFLCMQGKYLGIHLILTMQAPGGVITGRMEANLDFCISMRTASVNDSREVIGTDEAFKLSKPGRAIIKAGHNFYEHIQTFYSKAPYRPGSGQASTVNEIKLVELNGYRHRILREIVNTHNEVRQESVVVQRIIQTAKENNIPHARPVWTEPLPTMLALDELIKGHEAFDRTAKTWSETNKGLAVIAGRVDAPREQSQYPLILDFMKDGHQVLYGAPSTGKTSFLQTVILSAALSYTPEQVNFVILDYGSYILRLFETLPHCIISADSMNYEKEKKAYEFLRDELTSRGKLFRAEEVTNIAAYREATGKTMPAIIVAVDNIASLNEQNGDLMDILNKIARDGSSLGIYLMIASGITGSFMYKISNFVKCNHTLQMTEKADYRLLVGGDGTTFPGNYPGRGLTKGGLEYQAALCVDSESENSRIKKLKALCTDMAVAWKGKRASLEDETSPPIQPWELASNEKWVQLGMKKGTRKPVEFVFSEMNGCVISGAKGGGKSAVIAMIAQALDKDPNTTLFAYEENTYIETLCPNSKTVHKAEDADALIAPLAKEYETRDEDSKGRIVLCIDDFYNFYHDITQESADILEAIVRGGSERGMYIYVAVSSRGLETLSGWDVPLMKELISKGNAIITGGINYEGCITHNGEVVRVMFGQPEGETNIIHK